MKKVLSFILALTLLISAANAFALPAFGEEIVDEGNVAAEGALPNDGNVRSGGNIIDSGYFDSCSAFNEGTDFFWELDDEGVLTVRAVGGKGDMGDFFKGTPWRKYRERIKKVVICDGITSFGQDTFESCTNLTEVYISASVNNIYGLAFSGCSNLTNIVVDSANTSYYVKQNCLIETATKLLVRGTNNSIIPDDGSILSLDDGAFASCNKLVSVTIPDGVRYIGEGSFSNCTELTEIYIPESVYVGWGAFSGCSKLTDIYCEIESKPDDWDDGWNENATVHWGYKKSIPGDTDGDGKINTYDIVYLINHLIYEEDYPVNQNVDFDGDGKVNTYDAIYLLNHLIFEDEYPLS